MAGGIIVLGQMQGIDLRRDAPYWFSIPLGEEKCAFGMFEKGIVIRFEVELSLQEQGRNPVGIVAINRKGQVMEIMPIGFAGYGQDRNWIGHGFTPWVLSCLGNLRRERNCPSTFASLSLRKKALPTRLDATPARLAAFFYRLTKARIAASAEPSSAA